MKTSGYAPLNCWLTALGLILLGTAGVASAAPLTLDAAIAAAYAHNPDLAGAAAGVRSAAADAKAATALGKLKVSANAYGTTGSMGSIAMSSPDVAPQSLISVPANGFVDQNFSVTVPLSTGGRTRALARAAQSGTSGATFAADAMLKQVAADVSSAYIDAALASDLVAVAQGRVQVEDEQVRVIAAKVENGKMAPVDQLREEAELADAKQALVEAQTKASLAVVTLKGLIGLDQNADVSLADGLDTLETRWLTTPTLADALAAANARPEVAAARAAVDAARSQSDAAKALYAPQVSGFGMADLNARLQGGGNGSAGYTVGVVASLPLADGGTRSASTAGAQAQVDRANASLTGVQNKIAAEVASALLRVAPAASQVDAARAGLAAASKASELADMRYQAGKSIAAERLDALYALTRAQANLRQAITGELQARLALVRATGGEIGGR